MTDKIDITGVWRSRYEYGRGAEDAPHLSEHDIEFIKQNSKWLGKSLPNDEGSEVQIELSQNGNEFGGTWLEKTSKSGHYQGKVFSGFILLLISDDGQKLEGMWLGAGSRSARVKTGKWELRRI